MIILGINAYHGDVSAVLLRDGELVAAVEEERFQRVKHWAGFPRESIHMCLQAVHSLLQRLFRHSASRGPWYLGLTKTNYESLLRQIEANALRCVGHHRPRLYPGIVSSAT